MPARDDLNQRYRGYSEFGAVHRIVPTREVFNFFAQATYVADEIIIKNHEPISEEIDDINLGPVLEIVGLETPDEETPDEEETRDESWYDQEEYYRIYDHSSVWVGVLEANASRKKAQAARRVLQAKDVGVMKQEAIDFTARKYPDTPLKLLFDSVTLVGRKQANGNARGMQTHVSLVPNLEHYHETIEKIFGEYDIITDFLRRHYRQTFLSDRYTPTAEFMTFRNKADHRDITEIVSGLKKIILKEPLHVPLKEIEFPDPRFPKRHRK
jgi:hypothetical protein